MADTEVKKVKAEKPKKQKKEKPPKEKKQKKKELKTVKTSFLASPDVTFKENNKVKIPYVQIDPVLKEAALLGPVKVNWGIDHKNFEGKGTWDPPESGDIVLSVPAELNDLYVQITVSTETGDRTFISSKVHVERGPKKVKLSAADHAFNICVNIFMVITFFVIFIPLWSTFALSFRSSTYLHSQFRGMFEFWTWVPDAYKALLGNAGFIDAFISSFMILIGGVVAALFLTIPMAYVLSVHTLPGRKWINVMIMIPYVFNVGMIPAYLLVKSLGLIGHIPAVFLPGAISTYNCIIMKQFFEGIPIDLKESARIDGCNEVQILFKIMLPLSKAIIMTVGLFYAVSFWNDFFHPMLYLDGNPVSIFGWKFIDSNYPLPILLRNILMASGMNEYVEVNAFGNAPVQAIKAASVFMSAIPMIIAYPFIQKYFTKGTLAGAVKG